MRKNITRSAKRGYGQLTFIESDWFPGGVPSNVVLGEKVYVDTSYGFAAFNSERKIGFELGDACGIYDRASFIVGKNGIVKVGAFSILNGTTLVCNDKITIGNHCMLAWGSVITDSWNGLLDASVEERRAALHGAAKEARRCLRPLKPPRPVVLEDNVWIGFGAVVLPGVTLGRGCIVGCKSVIYEDVAPYAVMVGDPPRRVRYLEPDEIASKSS